MTARFFNGTPQFFTDSGKVVAGGFINFWATGTTNNQDTFPTSALSGANANPVPLDAAGRPTVNIFADPSKSFSVRVIDADSVVIVPTIDNVSFVRSNVITAADVVAALTANAVAGVYNGTQMTGTAFANFASNLDLTAAGSIDTTLGAITVGNITFSGPLSIDDTTDSTSGTTGSIHTDGGLGVVKDIAVDNDILLTSSGSILSFNADITLTHASNKLTFAGGDFHIANGNGVVIGHTAQITGVAGTTQEFQILGTGAADSSGLVARFTADATNAKLDFLKSRGVNVGNVATIVTGDKLGEVSFYADDGTDFGTHAARILVTSEGTIASNRIPTKIEFQTGTDASPTVVGTALTLDSAKNATFAGNVILASGQGIDFSATADGSGTTTSEVFDDYEEGTFTPVLEDISSPDATYSRQEGNYTKIGRMVQFQIGLTLTSLGTLTGGVKITGLPFTSKANASGGGGLHFWCILGYCSGYFHIRISTGIIYSTQFRLMGCYWRHDRFAGF